MAYDASKRVMTKRQKAFADHYLECQNVREAARKAGYADNKTGGLLTNPRIKAYLEKKMARFGERHNITQDRIMRELARVAFMDPRLIAKHGLKLENYSEDDAAALDVEVSDNEKNGRTIKVRMQNKIEALEKLAKIYKLYPEKNVTVQNAVVIPGMTELLAGIDGTDTGIGPSIGRSAKPVESTPREPPMALPQPIPDSGRPRKRGAVRAERNPVDAG